MWKIHEINSSSSHFRFSISEEGKRISNQTFLNLLQKNDSFIDWYNTFLANTSFDAFFWENKPMTSSNLEEGYECNLVQSEILSEVAPDGKTFDRYFQHSKDVVSFTNLGGDATLIAPCPNSNPSNYTQIGRFIRNAPATQIQQFWYKVGEEMFNHICDEPRWLSTSGLGVYWLHVRIDSTPKYYQTQEYKELR